MQEQEITQTQAIGLLIQAADIAQSRGAFKLEEAALITRAIHLLVPERANPEPSAPVEDSDVPEDNNE